MSLIKISGSSMSPTLNDGDYVITKKIKPRSIRPGFIYVIDHIDLGKIVKRLTATEGNKYIFVGDNKSSVPSKIIAPVSGDRITRQAVYAITKSRIKRLGRR